MQTLIPLRLSNINLSQRMGSMRHPDLIGIRFGKLTVVESAGIKKSHALWRCHCDCGNDRNVTTGNLKGGYVHSCGCDQRTRITSKDAPDFIGTKYGRLVVVGYSKGEQRGFWDCLCECGNTCKVPAYRLLKGHTKSCGCLHNDSARKFRPKEVSGAWKLFSSYKSDAKRRGIEFKLVFEEFKKITSKNCIYCGLPPSSGNSSYHYNGIDRINSSKGYLSDNIDPCCWKCNTMKWNLSKEEFLKHIETIYSNLKGR